MKCTYCGEETDVQYRLDDVTPALQGMCRHCALNWGETATVCNDCKKVLGRTRTAYELRGHYYCESCFLQKAEITEGDDAD